MEQVPIWVPFAGMALMAGLMKLTGASWASIGMIFGGAVAMFVGVAAALFALFSGLVLLLATLLGAPLNPELMGPWLDLNVTFIISVIVATVAFQGGQLAIGYGFAEWTITPENDTVEASD